MATLKPKAGIRLTVEEFLELPDTEDRRKMELDDGETVTSCPDPGESPPSMATSKLGGIS